MKTGIYSGLPLCFTSFVSHLTFFFCLVAFFCSPFHVVRSIAQRTGTHVPAEALFDAPDTVCVGELIDLVNLTTGGSSFYWNFCSGNLQRDPEGVNIGNPGYLLNIPTYITLVNDGDDYFSFVSCQGWPGVVRNYHGANYINNPLSSVDLGDFGVLGDSVEGVQILNDNGNWIGFINNNTSILRLEFGNSLWNSPIASEVSPYSFIMLHDLEILQEGDNWIGFCTSSLGNRLYRLNFGNSLLQEPVVENLGNVASFNQPGQLSIILENGTWYMIIMNRGDSRLSRLTFGSSLLSTPVGENLGISGLADVGGMEVIRDCGMVTGYVTKYVEDGILIKLQFPDGVTGPVKSDSLGDIGNLKRPNNISELIRVGDTLYAYLSNRGLEYLGSYSFTRLIFPCCQNASIPTSTLFDPPLYIYNTPGTYTVRLLVDEGTPYQTSFCKTIEVTDIGAYLGPDRILCEGESLILTPGPGFSSYSWSTGSTSSSITVTESGKYWVTVTIGDCSSTDSITAMFLPDIITANDTSICFGDRIHAGGDWQTMTGSYYDTLVSVSGCDSILQTNLTVKPEIPLDLGPDSLICQGETVVLQPGIPDATYLWQDQSTGPEYTVQEPGIYWVTALVTGCERSDTIIFRPCSAKLWFPTAFTPNGDGLNDTYRPVGVGVSEYHLVILNRWGQKVFETSRLEEGWDGTLRGRSCEASTYSYIATYKGFETTGNPVRTTGTFTLLR